MANLTETSTYDAGVYQIELTDPVIGGASGITNTPLKNLANRTKYLKDHVDIIESTYATKASPALTGTPTAPTAASGTSTTQLATTAFVGSEIVTNTSNLAPKASPALTGTPTAPTPAVNNSTTQLATTAFVNAEIANDAAPISHVGSTGTTHGVASTTVAGFMSSADKSKLDSIAAGATVSSGTITSVTGAAPISSSGGTTPAISISAATTTAAGSMSAADKQKLDGIGSGANTAFAAGTKIAFFQAAAPTGWTQDITVNNCMLRAVNAAGGGSGGTDSPILNDKTMVAHTHSFTGNALSAHTHTDSGHTHTDTGSAPSYNASSGPDSKQQWTGSHNTGVGYANISSISAGTPSGSISSTAAVSWTPKYIDMIICAKN